MKNKSNLMGQLFRFAFVGATAFLIDAGILYVLTDLFFIHYLISGTISIIISVVYNYILSVNWVYNTSNKKNHSQKFIVFAVLSLIGLAINQLLMFVFVDIFNIYYMLAKIIVTAFVMVYNFLTRKFFLESKNNN